VGAFNVITVEHAEAIVTGAEDADLPVILQISENAVRFHDGRLAPIAAAARRIAERRPCAVVTGRGCGWRANSGRSVARAARMSRGYAPIPARPLAMSPRPGSMHADLTMSIFANI
jgi:hypothetical protein